MTLVDDDTYLIPPTIRFLFPSISPYFAGAGLALPASCDFCCVCLHLHTVICAWHCLVPLSLLFCCFSRVSSLLCCSCCDIASLPFFTVKGLMTTHTPHREIKLPFTAATLAHLQFPYIRDVKIWSSPPPPPSLNTFSDPTTIIVADSPPSTETEPRSLILLSTARSSGCISTITSTKTR